MEHTVPIELTNVVMHFFEHRVRENKGVTQSAQVSNICFDFVIEFIRAVVWLFEKRNSQLMQRFIRTADRSRRRSREHRRRGKRNDWVFEFSLDGSDGLVVEENESQLEEEKAVEKQLQMRRVPQSGESRVQRVGGESLKQHENEVDVVAAVPEALQILLSLLDRLLHS